MSRRWLPLFCVVLILVAIYGPLTRPAAAIKPFETEFRKLYYHPESSDPRVRSLARAIEAARCDVCHRGVSKKDRNPYGQALSHLLDHKEHKRDTKTIRAALAAIAKKHVNANDSASPTFGDVLQAGRLPGMTHAEPQTDPR